MTPVIPPDMIERAAKCAYERNRAGKLEWSEIPEHNRYEWRAKVTPVLTAALGDTHVMVSTAEIESLRRELEESKGDIAWDRYHYAKNIKGTQEVANEVARHWKDKADTAEAQTREACAAKADAWSRPDVVRLAAGEMTAQELRTAQAVARGIAAAIRAATPGSQE